MLSERRTHNHTKTVGDDGLDAANEPDIIQQ
jgi:hypothetical protein